MSQPKDTRTPLDAAPVDRRCSAVACMFCGATPITGGGVLLLRVNPKGEIGKWLCSTCVEANLETLTDDDGIEQPNFVHSPDCPSYCDYACNHWGFEMAEQLKSGGR